ncbi:MAG: adenosine kinase [Paludibacteraceae bacterium]|nr:adenosine kinase [Paludibacteraceae bacterium]
MKKVLGLGNALTDILLQVSDEDVRELGIEKGSMNLININQAQAIQGRFAHVRKTMVAGGSAANTINAIASMGGKAALIGKIGNDEIGDFYKNDLIKNGAIPLLLQSDLMSGCCTVLITPDGERTFCTYLGAAADLNAEDIERNAFVGYDVFHVEGYMVQNHDLIEKAMHLARTENMLISLDLASYNVINENLDFIKHIVENYVDVVFANEDESYAYTKRQPEESVAELSKICKIAVVKVGKKGSYVMEGTTREHIGAITSNCLDSTGAGDLYAAGFLYGMNEGLDTRRCAEIGTLAAGRVVEIVGTKLSDETWEEIKRLCALYKGFHQHNL